MLTELKEKIMPYVIGWVVALGSVWTLGLSIAENSYRAVASTPTAEAEWYPGKLTADWLSQEMPEVNGSTSHDRFKALCEAYWLDASLIRELENKYNIREWVLLAILIAETSWGNNWNYTWEGCYNLGNVGNNDRWDRVCFQGKEESIEEVARTLNNKYLWNVLTLWCLSNAWSCVRYFDSWKRYATSPGNWERNIKNVLNTIYADELGQIEPSKFSVRRDFTSLQ